MFNKIMTAALIILAIASVAECFKVINLIGEVIK